MNFRVLLVFVVCCCCWTSKVSGQESKFNFLHRDINDGLSHNQVNCFLRDSRGFVWVGTMTGLNRYDGYSFKIFKNNTRDSISLIDNFVNGLSEDPNGRIWVSTFFGTCVYDHETEKFIRNTDTLLEEYGVPPGEISAIEIDIEGNYWFNHRTEGLFRYDKNSGTAKKVLPVDQSEYLSFSQNKDGDFWIIQSNGVFKKLDGTHLKVVYTNSYFQQKFLQEPLLYRIKAGNSNEVWLYFDKSNRGLYRFNAETEKFTHLSEHSNGIRLNTNIVRDVEVAEDGLIWVATDHGGLNIIDQLRNQVIYLDHDPLDDNSVAYNTINTLYEDREGVMWIGTQKGGINYYHHEMNKFPLYKHLGGDPNSLPYNDINQFVEDALGNLWIGTNGGGLIYFDHEKRTFKQYVHDPHDSNSLSNNVIVSLCLDHESVLWIGTYYGGLDRFDGKKFTHFRQDTSRPHQISDDNIWEIMEDSKHQLWIGTLTGGLNLLNQERNKFEHLGEKEGVFTGYITALAEDKDGEIWIGTGFGITRLNQENHEFTHFLATGEDGTISNNSILDVLVDNSGLIWVGTQDGLNIYDKRSKQFTVLRVEDGLRENAILSIEQDKNQHIWLSTPQGITQILREEPGEIPHRPIIRNFDESDGLQGKQFNYHSSLVTRSGELVFGGVSGFNLFDPNLISTHDKKFDVALVDFQIHNRSVNIGEKIDGRVILKKSILSTPSITLQHSNNVFSLEFAALSFTHPHKNRYRYRLEGFDLEWIEVDASVRKVTYTNLDPGTYTFRVISSNIDHVWNGDGASLQLTVLPPFWKSPVAVVIYLIVILAALVFTRSLILRRERIKFMMDQERAEAVRTHELDLLKIRFFTNVSHEFRTPLSLILAPVERMIKESKDAAQVIQFQLIQRNAKRLLNLVNQLLDFRRMEVQEIKLYPSEGDIVKFIKDVAYSFSDLSEKNNVAFHVESEVESIETLFDHNKLERILFNLISNAFKFTPEGGEIKVTLSKQEIEEKPWLAVKVMDTGIGIPVEQQERIFERFFQSDVPRSMVNQGSGIGLSITKEFVKIHGGSITVHSEVDQGSCFTILLPLHEIHQLPVREDLQEVAWEEPVENAGKRKRRSVILLVEDNEDFRFYLKDNLKIKYEILEARNGKEGLKVALNQIPDLIVSDVMMPEMDGITFCHKIKADQRISHIPVILLTARSSYEQKVEGFDVGADDYVTKPFSFEILQSRIKNLIQSRAVFQKTFQRTIEIKASEIKISSLDEQLIEKAIKLVEENISESAFSVEDLSHELGMSRVHLYKKLLSLTGKSPLEFIRTIRLQRAAQLLAKSQLTVAEIAYKVGFNNPKYFARYFKDQFNILPSAYAASKRREASGK